MSANPRVLAIAAHPDDIEFVMSGTMMRLQAVGYELHYLNVANGCCGSVEQDADLTAAIRRREAEQAAQQLNAKFWPSLTRDLEVFYEPRLLHQIGSIVRQIAPRIMLVHAPQDYMEDHVNACRLAVTAAFSRGMPNFPVDPPHAAIEQPVTLYHAQPHGNVDLFGNTVHPTQFVDVTDLMDRKASLLACHASQRDWLDRSQAMGSYVQAMRDLLAAVGRMSGQFSFAEGWRRHSHWGFCEQIDDPLADALGKYLLSLPAME